MGMFGIVVMVIENELSSAGVYGKVRRGRRGWLVAARIKGRGIYVSLQITVVVNDAQGLEEAGRASPV